MQTSSSQLDSGTISLLRLSMGRLNKGNGTSFISHQRVRKSAFPDLASNQISVPAPKNKKDLLDTVSKLEKDDIQHWCHFHTPLEDHCSIHRVHALPIGKTCTLVDPWGFIVGDNTDGLTPATKPPVSLVCANLNKHCHCWSVFTTAVIKSHCQKQSSA